jgi:hypothetical protein
MNNEPGSAVLAIFDQLINRIKQAQPVRSDGKPLGGGVVYSMMVLGMPVDPEDYLHPWSPMGGTSATPSTAAPVAPPVTAPAAGGTTPAAPPIDPKYAQSLEAAYKTAQLCNIMLQVTTDGTYLEYPTGRHLDFAYQGIIAGMQPMPMPPISPEVQAQIDDAQKVLYQLDPTDGSITGKSQLYKTYTKNAAAYALAKANYAIAMAAAKSDPAQAQVWAMTSATYQQTVNDAYDTFTTEGADKVERALDIIGSVGVCLQDNMIKKARQLFDVYNLGLAGVPAPIPYAFIEPSGWCDPDDDDEGWQQLTVSAKDYQHFDASQASSNSQFSWMTKSSTIGGSGGVTFGFGAVGGSASSSSGNSQNQAGNQASSANTFKNTASNLSISLEYALCTITRPGLVSDLFYMQNWYLVGNRKNCISDGTEANQANITDPAKLPLLPMIPQQLLVIRNVVISTTTWGSDGTMLQSSYGGDQNSSDSSTQSQAGSGGVSLGFINFGGSASHSSTTAKGQGSQWQAKSATDSFGTTFDGQTLKIPGAQIVAFLSDIVPISPPLDDPSLPKPQASKPAVSASTLQPA